METKVKNYVVKALNNGLKDKVTEIVNRELGLNARFEVNVEHYPWSEWTVTLFEIGDASKEAITGNPLLSQMFKSSKISVKVGYDELKRKCHL